MYNTKDKIKVVFYARVSTNEEEQLYSLQQQKEYFQKFINENNDWEYVGMYVDEGISGTNAKKRPKFMKMISDAKDKKFDLILTKEVSRFARNTVDTLHFTRELKKNGVHVLFTLDNIHTGDKDGELRLTIMASLAQEEARKVSERVRWGHEKSMQRGVIYGNGNILGYDLVDGKLTINEEQSKTVKLIYDLYLQGNGLRGIKTILENTGYKTPEGKVLWTHTTINRILKNEKYIGNLKQKKFITVDYLDKKRKTNDGEEEFILSEDTHEAIIPKEIFDMVQAEIERRRTNQNTGTRHSNKYQYSKRIQCALCGKNFKRVAWKRDKNNEMTYGWRCVTKAEHGKIRMIENKEVGCNAIDLPEYLLNNMMSIFFKRIQNDSDDILKNLEMVFQDFSKIDNDITQEILQSKSIIKKQEEKINKLLDLYMDNTIDKVSFKNKQDECQEIIKQQNNLIKMYDKKMQDAANIQERIIILKNTVFNDKINFDNKNELDNAIKLLIKKIVIYDKSKFDIYLNTDLSYNIIYDKMNNEITTLCSPQYVVPVTKYESSIYVNSMVVDLAQFIHHAVSNKDEYKDVIIDIYFVI